MLAKGIYNTTVRKTSQLDKKGKGSVLHRFFLKVNYILIYAVKKPTSPTKFL